MVDAVDAERLPLLRRPCETHWELPMEAPQWLPSGPCPVRPVTVFYDRLLPPAGRCADAPPLRCGLSPRAAMCRQGCNVRRCRATSNCVGIFYASAGRRERVAAICCSTTEGSKARRSRPSSGASGDQGQRDGDAARCTWLRFGARPWTGAREAVGHGRRCGNDADG